MTQESVFRIIGHITIFYSTLDFFVNRFIFENVTENYKLTHKPLSDFATLGQKLDLIKQLKEEDVKSVQTIKAVSMFIDEAIAVAKERNRFIHDLWKFAPEDLANNRITRLTPTNLKKWTFDFKTSEPYTEASLNDLLNRIGQLQIKFCDT